VWGLRVIRNAVLCDEIRCDMGKGTNRQRFELGGRAGLLVIRTLKLLDGEQKNRMPCLKRVLEWPQIDLRRSPPELREQASQQVRLAIAAVGRDNELRLCGPHRLTAWQLAGVESGELADERVQRRIIEAVY
jgi:hypothetical protein